MSVQFRNFDSTDSYAVLQKLPVPSLNEILTTERVSACTIPAGGGLSFNTPPSLWTTKFPLPSPILPKSSSSSKNTGPSWTEKG